MPPIDGRDDRRLQYASVQERNSPGGIAARRVNRTCLGGGRGARSTTCRPRICFFALQPEASEPMITCDGSRGTSDLVHGLRDPDTLRAPEQRRRRCVRGELNTRQGRCALIMLNHLERCHDRYLELRARSLPERSAKQEAPGGARRSWRQALHPPRIALQADEVDTAR
jgi:hypothetical protein